VIQQREKKEYWLRLSDKQTATFLFAVQGVGAVFVGIFLAAYLAGLPSTAVLHSEPIFRSLLSVIGVLLLIFIFTALVLSVLVKHDA